MEKVLYEKRGEVAYVTLNTRARGMPSMRR